MRFQDRFIRFSFVSYSNPSFETKRDFGAAVIPFECALCVAPPGLACDGLHGFPPLGAVGYDLPPLRGTKEQAGKPLPLFHQSTNRSQFEHLIVHLRWNIDDA
jgi:hypothetical protein